MKAARILKPESLIMGDPYVLIHNIYYYHIVADHINGSILHYYYLSDGNRTSSTTSLSFDLLFTDTSSEMYKVTDDLPKYYSKELGNISSHIRKVFHRE